MAYNDSGEIPISQRTYSLGGYTFELKVQTVHEPGEEDVVSVFAICRSPDGTRETVPMDFPAGTTFKSWSVEANETEASIYVQSEGYEDLLPGIDVGYGSVDYGAVWPKPSSLGGNIPARCDGNFYYYVTSANDTVYGGVASTTPDYTGKNYYYVIRLSEIVEERFLNVEATQYFTYAGKTVYYSQAGALAAHSIFYTLGVGGPVIDEEVPPQYLAWTAVYGHGSEDGENTLVCRFAIDIREADGGPDGDWDEPGDVGPDPEKHFTLTVSVTGASAGSNDGIPSEAQEQSVYGSGGYGGNGGSGGAGASTVIIYEFATNKADSVVQEATAQGPGTGGPGGKGGKGGDGCILIFY